MAVTKTHPIKSTLKAAIDYILNPEKTDGKLLASSFGCGLETADIEFAWTREAAGDRGTHLGRHLIQSFAVGETTPEEAHKIGMELAQAVLGGKYEFVLTTHVDKDHLHNHLIFNSVSFVDYKKYHSNKQSYGRVDIINRPFPAVLGVDRNNVFFLNGKAGIHAIKPPNPFYALSVYLSAAAPPVSCIRPASSKWTVFSAAVPVSRLLPLLQGR